MNTRVLVYGGVEKSLNEVKELLKWVSYEIGGVYKNTITTIDNEDVNIARVIDVDWEKTFTFFNVILNGEYYEIGDSLNPLQDIEDWEQIYVGLLEDMNDYESVTVVDVITTS